MVLICKAETCVFVFNRELDADKCLELSDLQLEEREPLSSATQETFGMKNKAQLAEDITKYLASMRGSYMAAATPFLSQLPKSRLVRIIVSNSEEINVRELQ